MTEKLSEQIHHGLTCENGSKPDTVFENALCIATHPGGMILRPFYAWFQRKYAGRYKFARLVFTFDLVLIGVVIGLSMAAAFLLLYHPAKFSDRIFFEAEVAPREVVTGAPSTLVIRYTNGTDEELRNVNLVLQFPDHFVRQEVSSGDTLIEGNDVAIGTLEPGAQGNIKIRGVMFGDVGGEQTFHTLMTFVHGKNDTNDQKISDQSFSPSRSALALDLLLPEQLVASQTIPGTITYKNTSDTDFPDLTIEPHWPDGFTYVSSSVPLTDGVWTVPAIKAGDEGQVDFTGTLAPDGTSASFSFSPSFSFADARYKQDTLTQSVGVVPPQVQVSHSVDATSVNPGGTVLAHVHYENTGDTAVTGLTLTIDAASPFAKTPSTVDIGTLAPGASGDADVTIGMRSSIQQSDTTTYENLDLTTRAKASYVIGEDGKTQTVVVEGDPIATPITTPVVLSSFGRYATETGDQLGRGPLPPTVGEETKYWMFWNVAGTINGLTNVLISGHLPSGVAFAAPGPVSQGEPVSFDPDTNTVTWTASQMDSTFAPGAKIVGIAFEVSVTPTDAQVGTSPTLLSNVTLTATDMRTGAIVTAGGAAVTTNLPNDTMAAGLGNVSR